MATLKDVAELAGVDKSTASRVLSNEWSEVVRPETRARILASAAELGYRPNAYAKGLRTRRSNTLGFVIPDLHNIGFADVSHGVQAGAAEADYLVLIADGRVAKSEEDLLERLVFEGRVDGLLLAFAQYADRFVSQLASGRIPLVTVNRRVDGVSGSVVVDDRRGAELAVDHLHTLGHRRIGFVAGPLSFDTGRRRDEGFRAMLQRRDVPIREEWIADGLYSEAGGYAATKLILSGNGHRPTGLFAANLMSALGSLRAIREEGLRVPQDMSVIAMDEHLMAEHAYPPITTVAMPLYEMGRTSVRMLIDAVQRGQPVRHVMIHDEPRVVARASTTTPPPDEPNA